MTKYEYRYDPRQYDPALITVVPEIGGTWLVMDGDIKSESCTTRAEAEAAAALLRTERESLQLVAARLQQLTVELELKGFGRERAEEPIDDVARLSDGTS